MSVCDAVRGMITELTNDTEKHQLLNQNRCKSSQLQNGTQVSQKKKNFYMEKTHHTSTVFIIKDFILIVKIKITIFIRGSAIFSPS